MLFSSLVFIFLLPIVIFVYFFLNKKKLIIMANAFLVLFSLFFYGFQIPKYVEIILFSVLINFAFGSALNNYYKSKVGKKFILIIGILINLVILWYFKYTDFFIANINNVFNLSIPLLKIALPLGISFYTFQQIAYLCDSYHSFTKEYDFLSYFLFVTFFPQLVAGPIVHHAEMMPQFNNLRNKFINYKNLAQGLLLFAIGLFKKVVIADTLAGLADLGFSTTHHLSLLEGWGCMLSYTFQIYYDFSGYTDMALGIALMFNIKLPNNFNNPYIAIDINDFWKRWHMTLTRFLRDYLYIPLGGNRLGAFRTYINMFIVFVVCGFWHGANWMFVIWGILHGIACIINKLWKLTKIELPIWLSWLITFVFVNFSWIFFRAEDLAIAKNMILSCLCKYGFAVPQIHRLNIIYKPNVSDLKDWSTMLLVLIPILLLTLLFNKNEIKILKTNWKYSIFIVTLVCLVLFYLTNPTYQSPFIYFNF